MTQALAPAPSPTELLAAAKRLGIAERHELLSDLYDSLLADDPDFVRPDYLPESHRRVIEERLLDLEANPDDGVSGEQAIAYARERLADHRNRR